MYCATHLPPSPSSRALLQLSHRTCCTPSSSVTCQAAPSAQAVPVLAVETKEETLSAKERRKQRNERREQLKAERTPWREQVERRMLEKEKPPPKGLKHELNMGRLRARGLQWWMVLVPSNSEAEMAELISKAVSINFPDEEFEIFVPTVPSKRKMKDGSISKSRRRLHSGCVFARFVMSKPMHDVIRRVPRCKGFFGRKVGSLEPIVMPTPVPLEDIEKMVKKIKEEEEDLERLIEQAKVEKQLKQAIGKALKAHEGKTGVNIIGSNIRVKSGPYINLEGCIMSPLNEIGKVEASLIKCGELINVELDLDVVEIVESNEASNVDRGSASDSP